MKKIALVLACLVAVGTVEVQALPSGAGEKAALATASACAALMWYANPKNLWFAAGLAAVASAFVGYIANKYTPESKFEWAQDVNVRAYNYAKLFEHVKTSEEIPSLATALYGCESWPMAVIFEALQGHMRNISDAVIYLEEAILDCSCDAKFVDAARILKKDLCEIACSLREIVSLVRKAPGFEDELYRYKMFKAEQQKVLAQRQMAMAQQQVVFNTAFRHPYCCK